MSGQEVDMRSRSWVSVSTYASGPPQSSSVAALPTSSEIYPVYSELYIAEKPPL